VCILTFASTLFVKVGCTVDGSTSPYYAKLIMASCPFTMVAISFSVPNELVQETTEVGKYEVEEIAIATEHAPFRHRNVITEVGAQRKKVNVQAHQRANNENFMQDERN
jgi:hypothetical protein